MLIMTICAGVLGQAKTEWMKERPMTLYDHFGIPRNASFEQIKDAKNMYLKKLEQKENPEYEHL